MSRLNHNVGTFANDAAAAAKISAAGWTTLPGWQYTNSTDSKTYEWNGTSWIEATITLLDQNNTIWVGTHGDDSNDGKSIEAPVQTITQAITNAKALAVEASIFVYPGTYTESITLDGADISLVGLGTPNDVLITNTSGNTLTLSNDNIFIRNVKIQNTGNAGQAFELGASVTNLHITNTIFECTHATASTCFNLDETVTASFKNCSFLQSIDTNTVFANSGSSSTLSFENCSFEGRVLMAEANFRFHSCKIISATTVGSLSIGDPGTSTYHIIDNCYIVANGAGGAAIKISYATAPVHISGGLLDGVDYSIDSTVTNSVCSVKGVRMITGMSDAINLVGQDRLVGSSGDLDYYESLEKAVKSIPSSSRGVVRFLNDVSVSSVITPNSSSEVVIKGDGFSLSRSGSPVFDDAVSGILDIYDLVIIGDLTIDSNSSVTRLNRCSLSDGFIDVSGGDSDTKLIVKDSTVKADAGGAAVTITDSNPTIILWRSYFEGHSTPTRAISIVVPGVGITNNNLYAAYCTFIDGNGFGTEPLYTDEATNYSGYHCFSHDKFDANMGAFGNSGLLTNNNIISGNQDGNSLAGAQFDPEI